MQGLNKIIGGLLGFLVAGPGGSVLGILIGHVFDRNLMSREKSDTWRDFWLEIKQRSYSSKEKETHTVSFCSFELKKAYEVLKLSEGATQLEIKQAYRRSMNRHHPDRLAKQDLSAAQLQKAAQKFQQIKDAYDLICKTKNFS